MTTAEIHTADTEWAATHGTATTPSGTMNVKGQPMVSTIVPIIITRNYTMFRKPWVNYTFADGVASPNDYPSTGLALPADRIK